MKEIITLETRYDYFFRLEGGRTAKRIRFECLAFEPKPQEARPLIEAIRARREEAVAYLEWREQPLDLAELLFAAGEKAEAAARKWEAQGKLELARQEWARAGRLFAASLA